MSSKVIEMPSPKLKDVQDSPQKGSLLGRCLEFPARSGGGTVQPPSKSTQPTFEANGVGKTVPRSRRNDRHDPSPAEVLLIRAGHHTWRLWKQALSVNAVADCRALDAALETIWAAKRAVRAELKAKRAKEAERIRAHFAEKRAS